MATLTQTFTANDAFVELTDDTGNTKQYFYAGASPANVPDPAARAVIAEYAANGTTSGTVTITAS